MTQGQHALVCGLESAAVRRSPRFPGGAAVGIARGVGETGRPFGLIVCSLLVATGLLGEVTRGTVGQISA